jgi:hypothetical protein
VFFGHQTGERIMKSAQKLTAAALSVTITLMGMALVSAPSMLAGSAPALTGVHTSRSIRQPSRAGQIDMRTVPAASVTARA